MSLYVNLHFKILIIGSHPEKANRNVKNTVYFFKYERFNGKYIGRYKLILPIFEKQIKKNIICSSLLPIMGFCINGSIISDHPAV